MRVKKCRWRLTKGLLYRLQEHGHTKDNALNASPGLVQTDRLDESQPPLNGAYHLRTSDLSQADQQSPPAI